MRAAEHAKTGIDKKIGQIVRVTHDAVDAVSAEDFVAYEHAFRDEVNENPENEQKQRHGELDTGHVKEKGQARKG